MFNTWSAHYKLPPRVVSNDALTFPALLDRDRLIFFLLPWQETSFFTKECSLVHLKIFVNLFSLNCSSLKWILHIMYTVLYPCKMSLYGHMHFCAANAYHLSSFRSNRKAVLRVWSSSQVAVGDDGCQTLWISTVRCFNCKPDYTYRLLWMSRSRHSPLFLFQLQEKARLMQVLPFLKIF